MFTSAPEAFLPAHYSCFLLSAKWIPIKSTVLQLEFGRIYLVQCSKSHCLTSFSLVAPFLESVTEKMRLPVVISCNRILLGFFVFFLFVQYIKSAFRQMCIGLYTGDIITMQVRLRAMVNCETANQDFVEKNKTKTWRSWTINFLNWSLCLFNCTIQNKSFLFPHCRQLN